MPGSSDDATTRLIRKTARRLLDEHLDEIVDRTVARTLGDEPMYSGGPVSGDDLRYHMDRTMRLALMRVAGVEVPDSLRSAALVVGQIRAQQGIPLASVLHAFRIDLRSLWESLIDEGHDVGTEMRADFLERSSLMVWEAVELNTEEVVRGYQAAQLSLDEIRASAFDQLLPDEEPTPETADYAGQILGLPRQGRYVSVVGAFSVPRPDLVDECTVALYAHGYPSYFRWSNLELLAVIHVPHVSVDIAEVLTPLGGHVCSAVFSDGLTSVARSIRLGRMAVRGRAAPGVERLDDTWFDALAVANSELSEAMHAAVFLPLSGLSASERSGLVETVGDLTTNGGTIADVARRTYRHRNTVRARLRDFAALTGFNLSIPKDFATVTFAFSIETMRLARVAARPSRDSAQRSS